MEQPREFSAKSIKETSSDLLETFSGDECNISLHSEQILMLSAGDGEPMRFDNLGISYCRRGEVSSEVNLVRQTVRSGEIELFTPGTVYRLSSMSEDCSLVGMAFSPYLIKELVNGDTILSSRLAESHRVCLQDKERRIFENMARTFLETILEYGEASPLTRGMASCIIIFVGTVIKENEASLTEKKNRSDDICREFVNLLNIAKGTKRTVGYFADKLCVSNHYLTMAVKQTSGQTVKHLIDKSVITEIKILLRHSDLTVAQIADRLEFPNSSFFCKYFKAQTGVTPLDFRKQK